MTSLLDVSALARQDHFLAVVSTLRADATIQSSVVNVGVLPHPVTGDEVIGFVTYGRAKLAHLRARPVLTVTVRAGWQWLSVEGAAELIGPDDPGFSMGADDLPRLLRDVFRAAGGTHDDWDAYDRTMVEQRRAAVLVVPSRIYGN